ncbi:MAG: metallophosphoesterase [Halobacteria archaeon]
MNHRKASRIGEEGLLDFGDELRKRHFTVDPGNWADTYIIGDVHGCYSELQKLLRKIDPARNTLLIFVGDLIRKGPDSSSVIDTVRENDNMVSVLGNNEAKVLRDDAEPGWLQDSDVDFIQGMPVAVSWSDGLVVHGGIDPRLDPEEHTLKDLTEMRDMYGGGYDGTFWWEEYEGDREVFFGHTVLTKPIRDGNAVGLDTGCVYGGQLTAYHLDTSTFVTVEPEEKYLHRSADSVVGEGNLE